jgi:hypothetical protein
VVWLGEHGGSLVAGDELDGEIMGIVSAHCSELFLGPGDGNLHEAGDCVLVVVRSLLQLCETQQIVIEVDRPPLAVADNAQ